MSDELVEGRTTAPLLRSDVERHLDGAGQRRLVLVSAPPGYGKTVLLEQWRDRLAAAGRPFLCHTPVGRDDASALGRALTRSAASLDKQADPFADDPAALLRMLPRGTVVFIDGFGPTTNGDVGDLITRWVEGRDHQAQIVLAASCEPDIPLTRMETYGLLSRIGMTDLALDPARAQLFLADLLGTEPTPAMAREFHELTEGWPVGLKLVSTPGSFHWSNGLQLLPRAVRRIDRFFIETVFSQLSDEQADFLVELAPLQQWDSELCEQLLGERHQPDFLETLSRRQCFVTETPDGALRPHRMFSEFLIRRRTKAATMVAHRKAASVLAKAGSFAEAVDQAIAAGDLAAAIEWAEECALDVLNRGGHRRVLSWLDALPPEKLYGRPQLCLAAGLTYYGSRQPEKALQYLTAGARTLRAARSNPDPDLLHQIKLLQTFYPIACDDSAAGRRAIAAPDSALTEHDVAASQLVRAWCALYDSGASSAEAILQGTVEEPVQQSVTVDLHHLHLKALVARVSGELHRSHALCMELHRRALSMQQSHSPMVSLAVASMAALQYEWGHLAEVEASLPDIMPGLHDCGSVEGLMAGYSALIRSQTASGKLRDAWATLAQIEDLAAERNVRRLLTFCQCERATLHIAQGDLRRAMGCAAELIEGVEADDSVHGSSNWVSHLMAQRAAAAASVAAGDPQTAIDLLLKVAEKLRRLGFLHDLASVQALMSVALHQLGQRQEARQYAAGAMMIGEPAGLLRSFADCGPAFGTVLRDLRGALSHRPHRKVSAKYLQNVLDYLSRDTSVREPVSATSIMRSAPLSSREADIARLICNGLSNKEIGRALELSNETVKWHLSNIYGKLDVSGRTEAVQSILKLIRTSDSAATATTESDDGSPPAAERPPTLQ